MERLNSTFRGKKKTTDVLSFPIYNSLKEIREAQRSGITEVPKPSDLLLGDIVINIKAARRQAREFDTSDYEEVRRLLIHGFLHLLGYDHEQNKYQETKMKRKEKELQNAFEEMD